MIDIETLARLKEMRLSGMAEYFENLADTTATATAPLTGPEMIKQAVDWEHGRRRDSKLHRLRRQAGLAQPGADIADIKVMPGRSMDTELIARLAVGRAQVVGADGEGLFHQDAVAIFHWLCPCYASPQRHTARPNPGRLGGGSVHHVAFRATDDAAQEAMVKVLADRHGIGTTEQKDRNYFRSVYFREPGGVLFEIATDEPGFATDEPMEKLGEKLALPPFLEPRRREIEAGLKPLN